MKLSVEKFNNHEKVNSVIKSLAEILAVSLIKAIAN
jgi:hypothetical protein